MRILLGKANHWALWILACNPLLGVSSSVDGRLDGTTSLPLTTATTSSAAFPAPSCTTAAQVVASRRRLFWMDWARGGAPNSLIQSVPADKRRTSVSSDAVASRGNHKIQHVVTKHIQAKIPPINPPPKDDTGFFYGLTVNMVGASTTDRPTSERKPKQPSMREAVALTLEEIREMREEMEGLRRELQSLKQELAPSDSLSSSTEAEATEKPAFLSKQELSEFYQEVGDSVAVWATHIMEEGEEDGWLEVKCNKVMRKSINRNGTTHAYLKWMKDPRGVGYVNPKDDREYPCLKCTGVIDAPLDAVCLYLSKERHLQEYNDLIETHKDLQEITPSSKICLGRTPQILFIRPRSLVTFCQHRWLPDGSQIVLNQACRYPQRLNKRNMGVFEECDEVDESKQPMAFALRGMNHLCPDPDDPENKTRFTFIAHGNPGMDVPTWAMKTAVGALANLEPFKLYHKINLNVRKKLPQLREELDQEAAQLVSSEGLDGRMTRPAGIAQLGYACFWPNGGGLIESKGTALSRTFAGRPSATPPTSVDNENENAEFAAETEEAVS